jgi:hypothetical protein
LNFKRWVLGCFLITCTCIHVDENQSFLICHIFSYCRFSKNSEWRLWLVQNLWRFYLHGGCFIGV